MTKTPGGFRAAVLIGWLALSAAGLIYARVKGIPAWAAVPLLAAFLFEYLFYLVPGFEPVRERLARRALPWLLAASGVLPYLIYSAGTGQFHWGALARLAALMLAVSFWYRLWPPGAASDAGLLVVLAGVILSKFFNPIYPPPVPRLDPDILGKLALYHVAVMVFLVERRVTGTGFGFIPRRRDWAAGLRQYLYFLPVGFALALALKAFRVSPGMPVWQAAATFFGFLWVVALAEEFFFRGLIQQWLVKWTGSPWAAIALTSVLFGLAHLGYRAFPNWRMAAMAAVAGWFYGQAFRQAGSVRASMVTHALVVTTWRALLV